MTEQDKYYIIHLIRSISIFPFFLGLFSLIMDTAKEYAIWWFIAGVAILVGAKFLESYWEERD